MNTLVEMASTASTCQVICNNVTRAVAILLNQVLMLVVHLVLLVLQRPNDRLQVEGLVTELLVLGECRGMGLVEPGFQGWRARSEDMSILWFRAG